VNDADELLSRYLIRHYQDSGARNDHLRTCSEATVAPDPDYMDSTYGCDTGCEYVRLEATIVCPHGESEDYEYGEFGDIAGLIQDLEREAQQ
jgi:hypothetical protein